MELSSNRIYYVKQRSTLEHSATFLTVIGVIWCIATCTLADGQKTEQEKTNNNDNDVCLTPGCVDAANVILKNMDRTVDPCDNFYQFACGGYLNSTNITDDHDKLDVFATSSDKMLEQLRVSCEAIAATDQPRHLRIVKNLYDSCMNTSRIETDGLAPLQNILKKLGGWPVLEEDRWVDEDFDWIKTSSKFHNAGYSGNLILGFDVQIDLTNSSRRVIYIDQPDINELYWTKDIKAYHTYMVDIAAYLGANRTRAKRELHNSLVFERKLDHISMMSTSRRDIKKLYYSTTLKQLAKYYSSISWMEWIRSLLPSTIILTENEPVLLKSSYIIRLQKLLNATPKRTVANYMYWRLVDSSIGYLNEKIRGRKFVFSPTMLGRSEPQPRWKECVFTVTKSLPISASALYVENYFNEEAKIAVLEMTANIKAAFRKTVEKVDWMANSTKKIALEKLDTMNFHVAYPDELLNDTEVNAYYRGIELEGGNYLECNLNASLFMVLKKYSLLRLPVSKDEWSEHGNAVFIDALYEHLVNNIVLPAGILQRGFFGIDRPRYLNYGGIGSIIGHEIIHGFDDVGSQFDKNLFDWWDSATKANFTERAECILNQYNNYIFKLVGSKDIDGKSKQGEIIADNEGFRQAYFAYVAWEAANKPEQALPDLPYTSRQMFWISMANVWCTTIGSKAQNESLLIDPHSPSEFRVIGALSNSAEFSEDFNCPVGSGMNPVSKCNLW